MNEPNLVKKKSFTEKIMGKQKVILGFAVALIITLFAGTSYSLLTSFDMPNNAIIIKDGDLRMTMNNTDGEIVLKDKSPESDEVGLKNATPIVLTFSNTGNINIMKYEVMLNKEGNTTIDEKNIRYSYSTDLGVHYTVPKSLDNNIIYTGYNLFNNKAKTMYLKIWIDGKSNEVNKEYYGKINVKLYKTSEVPYATLEIKDDLKDNRYLDSDSNNYVKFNYELWRIIGIYQDEDNNDYLRIVKDEVLDSEMIPDKFVADNDVAYNLGNGEGLVNSDGLKYYLNSTIDVEGNRGYLSYLANASKSMIKDTNNKVSLLTKEDIKGDWFKTLDKPCWIEGNEVLVNGNIESSKTSYVRPVIDLNIRTVILSGDGTKDNPYELSL